MARESRRWLASVNSPRDCGALANNQLCLIGQPFFL